MPYSLLTEKKKALDSIWFDRLSAICDGIPEIFIDLSPNQKRLNALRNDFVASNYSNPPDLSPDAINIQQYITTNDSLAELRDQIKSQEDNEIIAGVYVDRIDELIAHHNILIAATTENVTNFRTNNELVYGKPDYEIFAATCSWIRQYAQSNSDSGSEQINSSAKEIMDLIPDISGNANLIIPSKSTFRSVRDLHFAQGGYVSQLLAKTDIPEIVTPKKGEDVLEQVLKNLKSDYSLIDADVFWGIDHSTKSIFRPKHYELPRQQFTGIVLHEFGSHLLENTNGLMQPLQLLSKGLDRYDKINEGRAFLREQIVYENAADTLNKPSWEHIITMHLAISLSCGLYEHKYTFSEVYNVIYQVGLLMESIRNPELSGVKAAHEQAWVTTTRVLKGIPGETYMKDIVYLEGNVRCWQIAAEKPERILTGDLGKFDISRQDHLEILKSFNIDVL